MTLLLFCLICAWLVLVVSNTYRAIEAPKPKPAIEANTGEQLEWYKKLKALGREDFEFLYADTPTEPRRLLGDKLFHDLMEAWYPRKLDKFRDPEGRSYPPSDWTSFGN